MIKMKKAVSTPCFFSVVLVFLMSSGVFAASISGNPANPVQTVLQEMPSTGESARVSNLPGKTSVDAANSGDSHWGALYSPSREVGTIVYVNASIGSDTNDGSSESPWKSIHHAISVINDGGTGTYVLHIAAGTYSIANSTSGEEDSALVLFQDNVKIIGAGDAAIGSGDPTVIIDGKDANIWTDGIVVTGSNCKINGLSVTNFLSSGSEVVTDGYGILITGEVSGNEVTNCNLHENETGIEVKYSSNTSINHCKIYENKTDGFNILSSTGEIFRNAIFKNTDDGISVFNCSPIIERNKIYDNNVGIRVGADAANVASPLIYNNIIYETTNYIMDYGIRLEFYSGKVDPKIYHNTIDGGSGDGISFSSDMTTSTAAEIKYNNITYCDNTGISISASIGGYTIDYNDIWQNGNNYSGCSAGPNDISQDPQYSTDFSIQSTSPCINTIPGSDDPLTKDYPGFTRPRPGKNKNTMGAYEYVADVMVNYTMPGGTGAATDYRIFTIPLNLGTGANMLIAMESVLGTYDPVHWRAFLYNGTSYNEFNSSQFGSHAIKPGMGFWIITTYTDIIPFKGQPAPDGVDYVMDLQPGWYLIGLPWVDTNIFLNSIKVTDGVNTYALSDADNNLTQRFLWDFTGDGPFSGYEKRSAVGFRLQNNKGYFFKVLSSTPIRMTIPNAANANPAQEPPIDMATNQSSTYEDDEAPPPPPGAEPIPDIKVNGQDGPVLLNAGDSVAVSVSLDPGVWNNRNADWWVAAYTPFDPPWYTYVYPEGWRYGIYVCVQTPLLELITPFTVLNTVLPVGDYTFYFAVDGNMDGKPDATWLDSVGVSVK